MKSRKSPDLSLVDPSCPECGFHSIINCLCEKGNPYFSPVADCIKCEEEFDRVNPSDISERICKKCRWQSKSADDSTFRFTAEELRNMKKNNDIIQEKYRKSKEA